jgi:excinuclease UvrABC nuclease subunit
MPALDSELVLDPNDIAKFLEQLPAKPAVVLIEPRPNLEKARPLLLRTADLRRRMNTLLNPPANLSKRVDLRSYAERIRFRVTGSAFEQALIQWQHARALWPEEYRRRLRMRSPALIKLTQANPYPRAYVTRRAGSNGCYFGPFASRKAAEAFLESYLDLFRIRRCQIKILRDPAFPGCIYSEMKKCLAPCFAGCTSEEYATEVRRASDFLQTRGESLSSTLQREREAASGNMDFERAAMVHKNLEKADVTRREIPELARMLDALDAIIFQRGAEDGTVAVFVVRRARIHDPFLLRFSDLASQPRSVEEILRSALENAAENTGPDASTGGKNELHDHLALLARWFYARPRAGEIFFAEGQKKLWPYRRMLRACSRVLNPESV